MRGGRRIQRTPPLLGPRTSRRRSDGRGLPDSTRQQHWPTAQRLEEEGCATCLGWHENVSQATIRQAVQNLLNDPLERQAMARCARKLIDGRGPDRLVTALEVMLHPSRTVDLREAA